jgi:hypothetical protein
LPGAAGAGDGEAGPDGTESGGWDGTKLIGTSDFDPLIMIFGSAGVATVGGG